MSDVSLENVGHNEGKRDRGRKHNFRMAYKITKRQNLEIGDCDDPRLPTSSGDTVHRRRTVWRRVSFMPFPKVFTQKECNEISWNWNSAL